ncbi:hypothetical protein M2105_003104 [Paenibacillus sp. PastF-1]|nr:hypothetical protein [Paenibacillus sp. PastF-2]MDF9848678.1 hypothetical protein [Paenibacillus sp. PastM-2]MDF9855247.1 hypothetical protein [Paenibacillus sp. PastF-1]MDH6480518.1 hypothetical protein [Paenibacillus sp. PastH-2]MDH6507945.1 hypothetical protein [Paenibacillus sp. PastM-3]
MEKLIKTILLAMIPSILTIFLLIEYFPYTGLGRILSVPITVFLNIVILLISILITRKIKPGVYKNLYWITVILNQIRELIFTRTSNE